MSKTSKAQKTKAEVSDRTSPILISSLVLFIVTTGVVGYLAWYSFSGGMVAGCGPDSGCDQVLSSRWSSFFGIPVSVLALPVYIVLIIGIIRLCSPKALKAVRNPCDFVIPLCFVVIGAGSWFVIVQLILIKSICYLCMSSHLFGVLGALAVLSHFLRIRQSVTGAKTKRQSKSTVAFTKQPLLKLGL